MQKSSAIRALGCAVVTSLLGGTAVAQVPLPTPRPGIIERSPASITDAKAGAGAAAAPVDMAAAARDIFGALHRPAATAPRAYGGYARGCLSGGVPLAATGANWQAMRLARNRYWGHPRLVSLIERTAREVPQISSWPGILVGDMSQPRGGPMAGGHASHQNGLDADIWLTPMPARVLSVAERENLGATNLVSQADLAVYPQRWSADHIAVIRLFASQPGVERVLVNFAIKKALCRDARGDRSWLGRVRPYWGHTYHMHVRMTCPPGVAGCTPQAAVPAGDGCGAPLDWWFKDARKPKPPPGPPAKPRPPMTLAGLPDQCRGVAMAADAADLGPIVPPRRNSRDAGEGEAVD
jgi:penicillin-insensitive murein endopeptidase